MRGRVLVTVGFFLFALAIFGPMLGLPRNPISDLLESLVFLPLILIFVGRSMQRRERRASAATKPTSVSDNPSWMNEGRLPTLSETLRPKPAPVIPRPATVIRPVPSPTPVPSVKPVPKPPAETAGQAVGKTSTPAPIAHGSQSDAMVQRSRALEAPVMPVKDGVKPRSSEEMIADAKRRLNRKTP